MNYRMTYDGTGFCISTNCFQQLVPCQLSAGFTFQLCFRGSLFHGFPNRAGKKKCLSISNLRVHVTSETAHDASPNSEDCEDLWEQSSAKRRRFFSRSTGIANYCCFATDLAVATDTLGRKVLTHQPGKLVCIAGYCWISNTASAWPKRVSFQPLLDKKEHASKLNS